jgi:hypothetical protein
MARPFLVYYCAKISKFGTISIEKALKNVSQSSDIITLVFKGTAECFIHLRLLQNIHVHSILLLVFKQILFKLELPANVIYLPDVTSST